MTGPSPASGDEASPASDAGRSADGAGTDDAAQRPGAVGDRARSELNRCLAQSLEPGLYLVATPIGNLGDITLRALAVLARADRVYAEDTRHSGRLLSHFGIRARLRPYHEHNAERERPGILAAIARGEVIALISDAGTPLISDPGFKLVRDCASEGRRVTSLPGACAPLAALVSSGLPSDTFLFAGFLAPRQQARQARIAALAEVPATLVFFEAPSRVGEMLADLAGVLGDRQACVARELTKLNEELARGTLSELARDFANRETIKGEIVVVVGPPLPVFASEAEIAQRLVAARNEMSLRDAARSVAEDLGVPRKQVYDLGLRLERSEQPGDGHDD